jgi:hypothetical protein
MPRDSSPPAYLLHKSVCGFAYVFHKFNAINHGVKLFESEQPSAAATASKHRLSKNETTKPQEVWFMLWTIFVILLVLWLLGLVSSYTLGGYIHILLLIALVVLILQLVSGRRPVV